MSRHLREATQAKCLVCAYMSSSSCVCAWLELPSALEELLELARKCPAYPIQTSKRPEAFTDICLDRYDTDSDSVLTYEEFELLFCDYLCRTL